MRTLAIYNFKGGVGKTATAVCLSALAAREGRRVLLWDLDPQGAATFTLRIETHVEGGLRKLLRARGLARGIRASDYEGLDVLPSDFSLRHLDARLAERGAGREVLAELVAPLADEYDLLLIDCAPTLSSLVENVLTASDAVLAPTVPTTLSLRTLARFLRHVKKREGPRPRVLPFFCMVDRRKVLHRRVCDWSHEEGLGFLETEIPYSSTVEQMSVRRMPMTEFARGDRASRAYDALWQEVAEALGREKARSPSGRELRSLQERVLEGSPSGMEPREIEFKLLLEDRSALEALARAAERRGARRSGPVVQDNHFFDTLDARLRAQRVVVRLREEEQRFVLSIKGAAGSLVEGGAHDRPEAEAPLDEALARELLGRRALPLEVLEAALGASAPGAVRAVREAVCGAPLGYVGVLRNHRLKVGPLGPASGGPAAFTLELDRTELPGGRVDHEVELEVRAPLVEAGRQLLEGLCAEAGVKGRPATSKAQRFFEALPLD